jgi:CheY-like chemotaxis protein
MALILIADDDPRVRQLLAQAAQLDGHTVTEVADGRAALEACLVTHFDLVITDLQMPRMKGDELIAQLRAIGYRALICIVSGTFSVSSIGQMQRVFGADAALAKPFTIDALVAIIRRLMVADVDPGVL